MKGDFKIKLYPLVRDAIEKGSNLGINRYFRKNDGFNHDNDDDVIKLIDNITECIFLYLNEFIEWGINE